MSRYQVRTVLRPPQWKPAGPDDAPPGPCGPADTLGESDDLFAAVCQAVAFNTAAEQDPGGRWAVVVEPGCPGGTWPDARLWTPLSYQVAAIWWPSGWEPQSPGDVPNCVWKAQGETPPQRLSYAQASATVHGLNAQSMNHPGSRWFVLVAVENEPVSRSVSYDPAGIETTVEVRRLHVVRPAQGGGTGDCTYCPAHSLPCASQQWTSLEDTATETRSRSIARLDSTRPGSL